MTQTQKSGNHVWPSKPKSPRTQISEIKVSITKQNNVSVD